MTLENYKSVCLSIVKNTKNEGIIYLATDDHKAAAKAAEAFNKISTIKGSDEFFYVENVIAYLK